MNDESFWHQRYSQQANWTGDLRKYLYNKTSLDHAERVLEVGCGTGVILEELATRKYLDLHGVDILPGRLSTAHVHSPQAFLTCADARSLPFPRQSFDISLCHFLLLWVPDPLQALLEMKQVTRTGGHVLAMAEPDYYERTDKPEGLALLGPWQTEGLRRQGADPGIGHRLGDLFVQAGIRLIEAGPLRGWDAVLLSPDEQEMEWRVLEYDLKGIASQDEIQQMKSLDKEAWRSGRRQLQVPIYYAWGTVQE